MWFWRDGRRERRWRAVLQLGEFLLCMRVLVFGGACSVRQSVNPSAMSFHDTAIAARTFARESVVLVVVVARLVLLVLRAVRDVAPVRKPRSVPVKRPREPCRSVSSWWWSACKA